MATGHTLGDLMGKFAQTIGETDADAAPNEDKVHEQVLDGQDKTAADGGTQMNEGMGSLATLYLSMTEMDKTAAATAEIPDTSGGEPQLTEDDVEKIAAAEAQELVDAEAAEAGEAGGDEPDMQKLAEEYDAAGRIMARGFFDEYIKLANAMDTSVTDNQDTDAPSASASTSFGARSLPTLATNYAGAKDAGTKGKAVAMDTSGGKEVHKTVLKVPKTRSAGDTGDDPEGNAISTGGGAPVGFATVRDVMDSNR